ncbi:phosphatidylinositol 4-phosphate 5-kinase-like [Montipora foliosa]|uniref:phosphatidylinositol 4-phosphate 5-kinase-like n=1 Tax=Montipora foliosa TaxID=591990 RepID=UPI0035F1ACE0
MAAEDGINVLLQKADLQEFVGSFLTLGCTKVSHFVDVDNEMMKNIGMKDLQIKRLNRIFQEQKRTPPPENPDRLEAGQSHSVNELPVAGPDDSNETQPLASKMSKKVGPKQSVLFFQGGNLKYNTSDIKTQEKKPWEKYIYPYPKTERMKFYNSVIEGICSSGSSKHESYLRDQQSFRWKVLVQLKKVSGMTDFYENPASGIPKYCNLNKNNIKKCDRNICISLISKVEASVKEAENLEKELMQRRERLLNSNNLSGIKKGFEEEYQYLTSNCVLIQEQLKKLLSVRNNLNQSHLLLSRSRVQPHQTAQENARVKRRKKENKRKVQKDEIVLKGKEVPLELKIKKENVLNIQELQKMKPKFHLGALLHLRDKDIFSGNALDVVESTIRKLKAKDVAVALEDDDAEDIDDDDNDDDDNNEKDDNDEDDNDEDNNVAGDKAAADDDIDNDVGSLMRSIDSVEDSYKDD